VGAGTNTLAAPESGTAAGVVALKWEDLMSILDKAESDNPRLRIVRVWHPKGPDIWQGVYGNAIVEPGAPAYQFSSGEKIAI
jgi:hypothetical protein